jgi:hypothetical protein
VALRGAALTVALGTLAPDVPEPFSAVFAREPPVLRRVDMSLMVDAGPPASAGPPAMRPAELVLWWQRHPRPSAR